MKALWLTDIHLNFVKQAELDAFICSLATHSPDAVVISGDIGEADSIAAYLQQLAAGLSCPIYFVLGNHDFYRGSIADVRAEATALTRREPRLIYLSVSGVQPLTKSTCLVGQDGWPDGRYGNFDRSEVMLSDFLLIRDFRRPNNALPRFDAEVKSHWLRIMQELAAEAARHIQAALEEALQAYEHVIVATHVPPFAEASWYKGQRSNDDFLPFFSSKAVGDVLLALSEQYPMRNITVLCGHTHGGGEVRIRPNLLVLTGGAEYGEPAVQCVFTVD